MSHGKKAEGAGELRRYAHYNIQKCNSYRFAAATCFTISATAFHFFRMTGRFANFTEISPNDEEEPQIECLINVLTKVAASAAIPRGKSVAAAIRCTPLFALAYPGYQ